MSYRREIPKLNIKNFTAWQGLMRLHLATICGLGCKYLATEYKTSTGTLLVEDIAKKKNHHIMMIDIASALNYTKFGEVKGCTMNYDMWIKLKAIYGEDNVRRAKAESLKGKFDQIKMREDENIAKYVQ